MSPTRPTIATYGPRGRSVRVLSEPARQRILVQWYQRGKLHKRVFPSSASGKKEAKQAAEVIADGLARGLAEAPETIRGLWDAYREARWDFLRPRTRQLYAERWRQWELFVGAATDPEAITLKDVDRFRARRRTLKQSANQTRHILNVAKIVFKWAKSRKMIMANELGEYRWQAAKDEAPLQIGEHTPDEFAKVVAVLDPAKPGEWRLWCLLKLCGVNGARIRSARYLRWPDLTDDRIIWPAAFMKQGEDFEQPITDAAREAIVVAKQWRERDGYAGEYLFYARHTRNKEPVYTYQSAWIMLRKAEQRAGVRHIPYRAFHGLRRHAAGNAYDATKDQLAAAEWIGDRDVKQMRSYLKRREERLRTVADRLEGK